MTAASNSHLNLCVCVFMYLLFTYTVLPLGSTTTLEAGLVGRGDLTAAAVLLLGADMLGGVTVVLVYE